MPLKIYIDGKFYSRRDANVSVFDHGFLYGDGVFEGIRSYGRLVFCLKEHVKRLYESAGAIMLKIPITKRQMAEAVCAALRKNKITNGYVRLIVTRGEGDLGLDPRRCRGHAHVIIIADKIVLYPAKFYETGLRIITARTQQNSIESLHPGIKSLNYLNNILAKIEANKAGCEEAIMLNASGYVTECTGDNIFIIKENTLYTPPASVGILMGVTREMVLAIARRKGIRVKQLPFRRSKVYQADECFLTGTAAELIPVVRVDGKKIGNGSPGRLTLLFLEEFRELTKTHGVRY